MAAEPLRPTSWFPGAPHSGLGFPASSAAGPWRPNELVPSEVDTCHIPTLHCIFQVKLKDENNETEVNV